MKTCNVCFQTKPIDAFHRRASAKDGHAARCKSCRKIEARQWSEKNASHKREYALRYYRENTDKHKAGVRRSRLRNRAMYIVANARSRSKKLGLAFDLNAHIGDIQKRIDAGFCELSGIPFNMGFARAFDNPSLDRIDPAMGYVYSNIRIVCLAMNCALGNWGEAALLQVVRSWIGKRGEHAG